jgi:hypothetical protein
VNMGWVLIYMRYRIHGRALLWEFCFWLFFAVPNIYMGRGARKGSERALRIDGLNGSFVLRPEPTSLFGLGFYTAMLRTRLS